MRAVIKTIISYSITVIHVICTIVGAVVIVGLLTMLCRSCYYEHKPESVLYGEWEKVDSEGGYNGVLIFDWDGEYHSSDNVIWNYEFIEPDSLILYHHGLYEERYNILKLTEDTMTVRMSQFIFHAVDNGNETEADYSGGEQPIYTYIRKNHSRALQTL